MGKDIFCDGIKPVTGLSYCADQVRLYDYDRFRTAIFAPTPAREHLFALYAFNLEIAKTREVVSEPLIGQMRLQWWRDTLDRLYAGQAIAHEVARPLGEAIGANRLDRALFDRLIDARGQDLDDAPPPDLDGLEAYAEGTAAPLLGLALQVLGSAELQEPALAAARHIGIAWALTGLMRAVPFHAVQRRLYLPRDLMDAREVRAGRLFDLKADPGLPDVMRTVGARALAHLTEGRALKYAVPAASRSPLLLAELARLYLADLRRGGWNPFAPELRRGRPLALLRLAYLAARRRY